MPMIDVDAATGTFPKNEDLAELDALDRTGQTERALEHKWW
jgi:hypothetical protein